MEEDNLILLSVRSGDKVHPKENSEWFMEAGNEKKISKFFKMLLRKSLPSAEHNFSFVFIIFC